MTDGWTVTRPLLNAGRNLRGQIRYAAALQLVYTYDTDVILFHIYAS